MARLTNTGMQQVIHDQYFNLLAGDMEIIIILERPAIVHEMSLLAIPVVNVPSPWVRMSITIGSYSDNGNVVLQVIRRQSCVVFCSH